MRVIDAGVAVKGFLREPGSDAAVALLTGPDRLLATELARADSEDDVFHARVETTFDRLRQREPGRIRRVDGAGSVEEVAERVWAAVHG